MAAARRDKALPTCSSHAPAGYPASTWINDVRHKDARCIEPAA
jgi:hypothetical protein